MIAPVQGPVTAFYGFDASEVDAIRHDRPLLHVDHTPLPECRRYQVGVARLRLNHDAVQLHDTGVQVASSNRYCLVMLLEQALADSIAKTVRQQQSGTVVAADLLTPQAVELLQMLEHYAPGRIAYVRSVLDCPFWISYFGSVVRDGTAPTPEDCSYVTDTAGLRATFGDLLAGSTHRPRQE